MTVRMCPDCEREEPPCELCGEGCPTCWVRFGEWLAICEECHQRRVAPKALVVPVVKWGPRRSVSYQEWCMALEEQRNGLELAWYDD